MISENLFYPRNFIVRLFQLFKVIWWFSKFLDLDHYVGLLEIFINPLAPELFF